MKALIPAAGHGTRFAPWTKLIPKEMLPVGARPAIALIVEEAIEAGADEVVIITSPEKPLLKKWFELNPLKAPIVWVDQLEQHGLGHAVLQAAEHFESESEPVLILLGDALVSGGNASSAMMEISKANGGASVIGCEEVPRERVSRYGIMKSASEINEAFFKLADIVEKPAVEDAPSNLAVAGRYLLDPVIFRFLKDQTAGVGGEIQLTDAIRRMLSEKTVFGYIYPGHRHDIGNPNGYLKALEAMNENG
jgi:UTP--glucose-1-phosphate uridylyltransferase